MIEDVVNFLSELEVFMPAAKGMGINCFALLTRGNDLRFSTTR
jgi:hypothetical protein